MKQQNHPPNVLQNLLKVVTAVLQLNINCKSAMKGMLVVLSLLRGWLGAHRAAKTTTPAETAGVENSSRRVCFSLLTVQWPSGSCSPARRWGPWASRSSPGPLGAPAGTCHWRRPRGQRGRQRERGRERRVSLLAGTRVTESCSHPKTGAVGMKIMWTSRLHPQLPQRRRHYFLWDEAVTWGQRICVAPHPTRTHTHSSTLQGLISKIKLARWKKK